MKLCLLHYHFGPYHWARLEALVGVAPGSFGVEASDRDETYGWSRTSGNATLHTVLPGEDAHAHPAATVARRTFALLDRTAPTHVAVAGWSDAFALAALLWCSVRRRPAILMSDSTEADVERHWTREAAKRLIVGGFSGALAAGAPHVRYLRRLGFSQRPVRTGYDCVDNAHFRRGAERARARGVELRASLDLPGRYLLCVSRFVPKKNLPGLLEGYAAYRRETHDEPLPLIILGEGPLRPLLEDRISSLGLVGHVRLRGFVGYAELPVYLGLATALVHAATSEQWGLVVNEAMAAGLPVLVSRRCGCAEDLVDGHGSGLLFDPDSPSSIARELTAMASLSRERLATMGSRAAERVDAFSTATFARNLLALAGLATRPPVAARGLSALLASVAMLRPVARNPLA